MFLKFLQKDLHFGKEKETELLPIIQRHLTDDTFMKIKNEYSTFDFVNDSRTIYVELKSRRNEYNKYPTSIVGYNKIAAAQHLFNEKKAEVYFYFSFIDGLYYWKFNPDELSLFQYRDVCRTDRNRIEKSNYCFIPIEYLTEVPPENNSL
jgi:hypothetical protein